MIRDAVYELLEEAGWKAERMESGKRMVSGPDLH